MENKASDKALVIKLGASWRETIVTLPKASCWSYLTAIKNGRISVIVFLMHQKSNSFISSLDGLEVLTFYSEESLGGHWGGTKAPSGYYSVKVT